MSNEEAKPSKPNIVEVAKKKRHIHLLQKIQQGGTLSAGELRELQKLENSDLPVGVLEPKNRLLRPLKSRSGQSSAGSGKGCRKHPKVSTTS